MSKPRTRDRFWIAPLKPPLPNALNCELCGKPGVDIAIEDATPGMPLPNVKYVHAACLALFCEHHGVKPPDSFVAYCIEALGLRKMAEKAVMDALGMNQDPVADLELTLNNRKEDEHDQASGVDNPPRILPKADGH